MQYGWLYDLLIDGLDDADRRHVERLLRAYGWRYDPDSVPTLPLPAHRESQPSSPPPLAATA